MIIIGQGAVRLSATDLKNELEMADNDIRDNYLQKKEEKNYINVEGLLLE